MEVGSRSSAPVAVAAAHPRDIERVHIELNVGSIRRFRNRGYRNATLDVWANISRIPDYVAENSADSAPHYIPRDWKETRYGRR